MRHPWFVGAHFDWDGLVNLTLEPPWFPRLRSPLDTSYFELDEDAAAPSNDQPLNDAAAPAADGEAAPEDPEKWRHVWDAFDTGVASPAV